VPEEQPTPPPPRAFTQGVGTVFQFVSVTLFLGSMFICCASGLLSKETATRTQWSSIGWGQYSAQRATATCLPVAVFCGIAMSGIGLGLQAQNRRAPWLAVGLCALAVVFWVVHTIFFAIVPHSIFLSAICASMTLLMAGMLLLSIWAWREMRRNPPPRDLEILPADYKVPYSHLHEEPPEVRLARDLDQRRQRIDTQQKELEMLEERLRRKLQQNDR